MGAGHKVTVRMPAFACQGNSPYPFLNVLKKGIIYIPRMWEDKIGVPLHTVNMSLLKLPDELLQLICRHILVNRFRGGRFIDTAATIGLRFRPNSTDHAVSDTAYSSWYSSDVQFLRTCRKIHEIACGVLYGDHRFSCLQAWSFAHHFATQIGQSNLQRIEFLHIQVPEEC
jgi:hypothetical protein